MSYVDSEVAKALQSAQAIGSAALLNLTGPAGTVVSVIVEALGMAIDAVNAGEDPIAHLKRMRTENELLAGIRKQILEELKAKGRVSNS